MGAVEKISEAAGKPVVFVDNAIWLLCAKSGGKNEIYLSNSELAELAREGEPPDDRTGGSVP